MTSRCRMGIALAAAGLCLAAAGRTGQEAAARPAAPADQLTCCYNAAAHVFFFGNMGDVGSMTIESSQKREGGRLKKSFRLGGGTNADQIKKNRDFSGEFSTLRLLPLRPDDSLDERAVAEWRNVESTAEGFLKTNAKVGIEKMTFFPDHAVAVVAGKPEMRIEGSYGTILAPLEYLTEHDIKVGDVIDLPFILTGVPRIFRLEVERLTTLVPYRSRAYEVSVYAIDKTTGVDKSPKDVWRKKGNLKIWFCKDGPYRNQALRIKIKFRWYLWIYFDLQPPGAVQKASAEPPAGPDGRP